MHIVYQLSFWCLAEDLWWNLIQKNENMVSKQTKSGSDILVYMYMNICIFLKLSFFNYQKIFTIPIFYPAYWNQG